MYLFRAVPELLNEARANGWRRAQATVATTFELGGASPVICTRA